MIKMIDMLNSKKLILGISFLCCIVFVSGQSSADSLYSTKISGTVTGAATNLPLEGVNVSYKDISSTFTDSLGHFSLPVPNTKIAITISGSGYQTQIFPLKQQESIEISLYEEGYPSAYQQVNEFYSVKPLLFSTKSLVINNNNTEQWKNPGLSLEEVLKDKLSGLNIVSKSGMPGIGTSMFLRGFSSLYGSNKPLIVVDGFVLDNPEINYSPIENFQPNPLSFIDVTDIENITVIKDASTTYGNRAGNGVILISTQRSKDVATQIFFNALGGINFAPEQIPLLQADDYRRYLSEILQTSGLSAEEINSRSLMNDDPTSSDYFRYHNNTNWQDQVFSDGIFQKYNLRISGGDDIALYTLSVGYTDHDGILKNTGFNRYNARFNSDINISPKFSLNAGVSFTMNNYELKEEGLVNTSPIHQSLYKSPLLYPYMRAANGVVSPVLEDYDELGVSNPLVVADKTEATSDNYQIFGLFNINYHILKDLTLSNQVGVNFYKSRNNLFIPHLGIAPDTLSQGIAENKMAHQVSRYFNLSNDFRLTYNHIFNTIHHITGLAGVRLGLLQGEDDWGKSHNSPNDEMKTIDTGTNIFRTIGGDINDISRLTYYVSGEYSFAHRYLLSVNLSLDGASTFGKEAQGLSLHGTKFGLFPSVSAAWLASSESFMADINTIDILKFRLSYGLSGNSMFEEFPSSKYYTSQNFLGSQGLVKGSLWSPELQWETVTKMNVGTDIGVLNNRIIAGFDFFQNTTTDMINIIEADPLSGFSYYIDNNGSFKSTGIEVSAFFRPVNTKNLKWDLTLSYSSYKTEIIDIPNNQNITSLFDAELLSETGKPLGLFYGYKTLGVFSTQLDAEAAGLSAILPNTELSPFGAGDIIFDDLNSDGIIDENDLQVIGNPNPDFTGTICNKISWKGLSLEALISVVYGHDVFNHLRYQLESMQNTNNQSQAILNRWKTEGQITDIPKSTANDPQGNSRFSDRWIEDGSYIRLKYVTLSYKLPWKPYFIRGMEVFATGKNLVTLTNYLGYDPEFSISNFSLAQGIDIGLTPQTKSIHAGIKINF
jgi:TonB-linked SusC/RagA family outer membrane protein